MTRGAPPILLVPPGSDELRRPWSTPASRRWPGAHRPAVPPGDLDLNRWAASVALAIDGCSVPPLIVAHGFGALATLRATFLFERRAAGVALVAPADPDLHGALARLPATPLPYPTLLVASRDDPSLKLTKAGALATRWGSRFVVIGPGQDELVRLLRRFARQLAPRAIAAAA